MQYKYLPKRWKLKIADYLKDTGNEGSELNTHDFEFPIVDIKFKDGSFTEIERALVIDTPEFREVIVFTEENEYHIFNSDRVSIDIIKPENEKDFLIQKLQERNERLHRLIPIVAHDFKAPLRTIKGFSSLLQKDSAQFSKKHQEYLDYIIQSCDSVEEILLEHLDYSPNKHKKNKLVGADLKEILSDVKKDLIHKIEETQITIHVSDNLPKVSGQKAKMLILFRNFISLAIQCRKVGKEKSSVWVNSEHYKDEYVKISIKDNGIGIEEKYQIRIFYPFPRELGNTPSPYIKNFELGVCKKIIINYFEMDELFEAIELRYF